MFTAITTRITSVFWRRDRKLFSLYLASIVLFASIYMVFWSVRPDYFRVEDDVNFLPIDFLEMAPGGVDDIQSHPAIYREPALQSDIAKLTSLYSAYHREHSNLRLKTEKLAQWKPEIEKGRNKFETSMWKQHDAYIENQTAPFAAKLEVLSKQQAAILTEAHVDNQEQLPSGAIAVQYANISVEAAQIRLDMANVEFAARDFALKNLTLFQQTSEQKSFLETRRKFEELESDVSRLKSEIWAYRPKIHDAVSAYYTEARKRLTYADFLYFSFGAATTATFGDIAPNHWIVRLLVCIQVFISILALNLWVGRLAHVDKVRQPYLRRGNRQECGE